ncbi:K02A2.6-like [Cordylochernes scorpioides]|uniref:K02A2.6-like n=1 Tax=Cordylochernes scorpioides TaxID=51811 RepID=A0ABY6L8J2_9ARAC|nr:K02A2.6-like [Cordylochernes scorpioides]
MVQQFSARMSLDVTRRVFPLPPGAVRPKAQHELSVQGQGHQQFWRPQEPFVISKMRGPQTGGMQSPGARLKDTGRDFPRTQQFPYLRISEYCEYANLREELIRDRLVLGVKDRNLEEELMLNENLTLAKVVEIARKWEAVMREQQDLNPSTSQVDTTRKVAKQKPKASGHGKDNGRSTKNNEVNAISLEETLAREKVSFVYAVRGEPRLGSRKSRWKSSVRVNGTAIHFKLDPGSIVTLIPFSLYKRYFSNVQLTPTNGQLMAAANLRLENAGTSVAKLRANTREMKDTVYVVHHLEQPLLSVGACEDLQLVRRIDLVINGTTNVNPEREFPKLFEGLGLLEQPYQIKFKEGAKPFYVPVPRRVPLPLMPKLKEQLDAMVAQEAIEPVDEPMEWCAPIVLARKPNGKIRICVDLSRLNLSVEHANSGFWQIKLSEESQTLTTFITLFGKYKFKRLPIGISSAPEHLQKRMSAILRGFNEVICLMDDILIFAKRKEEHDETLREVLRRLKNSGITLNKEKCLFGADEKKVKAIAEMKPPANLHGVQGFMGMVNFLGRFVPNLAEITKPLNDIRKKDDFVVGKTFLIETDHKPLDPIFTTKDLNDLTPRLQQYYMRMLQFSFHIFHTPGKDLITADAQSRQPLPERSFYDVRDEIGEENGLLMKGLRVIIPSNMRKDVLNRIHAGIGKEIQDMVKTCEKCIENQPLKNEPLSHPQRVSGTTVAKSWNGSLPLRRKIKFRVLALMEYRATPLAKELSPAELLYGRKIRTMKEEQRKLAQKTAFDRRHAATKNAELIAGERVWVMDLRAWRSVIEKTSAPRSYIVETPVGTYRRNSFLLASSQQQVDPSETSPDSELPAETEETPGNELLAEELQQQTTIAPEMKQLSPSSGKVSRRPELVVTAVELVALALLALACYLKGHRRLRGKPDFSPC